MRSKCRGTLAAAIAVSLVAPGVAAAGIPKFKPKTIVPGKSIGGVKIGMTKKKAVKAWGKPDRSQKEDTATWYQYVAPATLDNGFVTDPVPYAGFYVRNNKVIEINIETANNTDVDPTLNKLKTSKDIKLHSTMAEAEKAYGFPTPTGGEAGLSRGLYKQGKRCTLFYAPTEPYTDIDSITVGLCSANVGMLIGIS